MTTTAQDTAIANVSAAFGGSSTPAPTGTQPDALGQALQDKLMNQSPMVSSDNTSIDNAIAGMTKAGEATHTAATLSYDRQIAEAQRTSAATLTSAQESQRGFAVNTGLIKNITETSDANIKDLELRKQEALAVGDAAAGQNIANLQMQALTFKQQAQQQVFTNLLAGANYMLNARQIQGAENAQTFTEKSAVANIALQYGLTVQPGDTIESITTRAMPFASEAQRLSLDKIKADIAGTNAQARAALINANANAASNATISATDIDAIAQAALKNPAVLGLVKNPNSAAAVLNKMTTYQQTGFKDEATVNQQNGVSKTGAQAAIYADTSLSASDKLAKLKAIEDVYGTTPAEKSKPFNPFMDVSNFFRTNVLGEPALK